MGPQPSTLNCKIDQTDGKRNQIKATKEFAIKVHKQNGLQEQTEYLQNKIQTQNVLGMKSPRTQMTRTASQKSISVKVSRQNMKQTKIFIPQHQAITKVSQTSFKSSIKQKKFYVQQKLKSLGQIVQTRYNTSKHFPYSQILGLTQNLVYSLAYFTKKKCNHHDFYPTNIYYIDGKFKIINPLQLQATGYYLTSQRQRFSFLSPELIIGILEQATQNDLGQEVMNKSDVFAIGMILLETCSLQPSSECYDEESYNIIDSVIRERLSKIAKVYTPNMAEFINLMLQYEVEARFQPLKLAQLVHFRVEQQKQIAMQMQAPKPQSPNPGMQQFPQNKNVPRPGPPGPPGPMGNMNPPQLIPRGPPPPPYNHQPFRMQNLNQNVIAVSMPNQTFTRIGPNNQGFLSASSLQQKLRVIQLIKQNPHELEDEGQNQHKPELKKQVEKNKLLNPNQNNQFVQKKNENPIPSINSIQNEPIRPQYPFVESIYSQKPLYTEPSEKQIENKNIIRPNILSNENRQNQKLIANQNYISSSPQFTQYTGQRIVSQTHLMKQGGHRVVSQQQFKQINARKVYENQMQTNFGQQNMVGKEPQIKYQQRKNVNMNVTDNRNNRVVGAQNVYTQSNKPPMNYGTNFHQTYGTSLSPRNSPPYSVPTQYKRISQKPVQMVSNSFGSYTSLNSGNSLGNKYGMQKVQTTNSQQGEQSLEQRVQRVLNMSKNIK